MTLLNNYFIINNLLPQNGVTLKYEGVPIYTQHAGRNPKLDNLLKLKTPVGKTLLELINENKIVRVNTNSGYYTYLYDITNAYLSDSDGYSAGDVGIGTPSEYGLSDLYLQSVLSTYYSTRSHDVFQLTIQTPTDLTPFTIVCDQNGYGMSRTSDYFLPAAGNENDSTPVVKTDYTLENPIFSDEIQVSATKNYDGVIVLTLNNVSNASKTVRQIGLFNCLLRIRIKFDANSQNITIANLTSGQKDIIDNAYNNITGFHIEYPIDDTSYAYYDSYSNVIACLPILMSKCKLSTPIVLQPGESKSITYEIKY